MMDRFVGKVALVTGAGAGIGKATAIRLAQEGASVIALDRNAGKLDAMIAGAGVAGELFAQVCDVSDANAVDAAVAAGTAQFGPISVLVNSAGFADAGQRRFHETTPEAWDHAFAVNVRGSFLTQRAIIPQMLALGGGAIINLGSVGSFRATVGASAYVSTKGAVLMMTRAAALEYARDNIRVNAVCPGTTRTDILEGVPQETLAMLEARAPQGRLGEPEEVAALIAFLASDEAKHINGGAYLIDGGRCAG